jgi:hypothetical protein
METSKIQIKKSKLIFYTLKLGISKICKLKKIIYSILVLVQTSLHYILFTYILINSNRFTAHVIWAHDVPKLNVSNVFILILKIAYVVITTESVNCLHVDI